MTPPNNRRQFAMPDEEILEVLDSRQRPLMLMPRKYALKQGLPLKVALIVLRDKEDKIYIHQRSSKKGSYSGDWGPSAAGYVKAGESFKDAALRELAEELGVSSVHLKRVAEVKPDPSTGMSYVVLFVSNPANVLIRPDPDEIAAGMFVDRDELEALLRDLPELVTPALQWASRACDLFSV
jgi:isopentenyl-diphosphate delta-isomerase